ncbi:MAG: hypothetical protein JOZ54_11380 [Acidobacteria bacterium]|nr:hypothetical protein [Acidobacteriota bacterium]
MEIGEQILWVVIEVSTVDGKPAVFVEPGQLSLEHGFDGMIIWYVFTKGYELSDVSFAPTIGPSKFPGTPKPDPDRPGCFSVVAENTAPGKFPYTITVLNQLTGEPITGDPVVENEPPPTMPPTDRPKRFGLTAAIA